MCCWWVRVDAKVWCHAYALLSVVREKSCCAMCEKGRKIVIFMFRGNFNFMRAPKLLVECVSRALARLSEQSWIICVLLIRPLLVIPNLAIHLTPRDERVKGFKPNLVSIQSSNSDHTNTSKSTNVFDKILVFKSDKHPINVLLKPKHFWFYFRIVQVPENMYFTLDELKKKN